MGPARSARLAACRHVETGQVIEFIKKTVNLAHGLPRRVDS